MPDFGKQLAHRGDQDQRVDERVHAVERPSGPGGPEAANLVFRKWSLSWRGHGELLRSGALYEDGAADTRVSSSG